jgi:hypothetical protein
MYRYLLIAALSLPAGVLAADVSVSGHVSVKDQNKSIDVTFTNNDRAVIQEYYRSAGGEEKEYKHKHKDKKVPPGLAKKGGLPPGIAKRQRLPEEVRYEPLPPVLEAKLPPLPSPDYVRVRIGQDFAILHRQTRVVMDVALGLGN